MDGTAEVAPAVGSRAAVAVEAPAARTLVTDEDEDRVESLATFVISNPHLPDTPVVHISEGFLKLTGYSREEALGRNCRFLQGPRSDSKTLIAVRDALQRGEGITVKLVNYKKDRTVFWNLLCIVPVPPHDWGPGNCSWAPRNIYYDGFTIHRWKILFAPR